MTQLCYTCGKAPRASSGSSYCKACHTARCAKGRKVRAHLPCVTCKDAPRVASGSYCKACTRARLKESRTRTSKLPCAACKDAPRAQGQTWCKPCATAHKWGMPWEDLQALWESQGHACAICRKTLELPHKRTHVDHDHKTGAVRGVLCMHCNTGLGQFRDNTSLLQAAIEYLKKPLDRCPGSG